MLGTNNCNPSEQCVNNPGSFWCNPTCRAGYQLDPQNPQTCIDIDECQEKVDTCHRNKERCRNTEGSFICEPVYHCQPGYKKTQNDLCVDIDECAEGRHNCIQGVQLCINTLGSYNCVDHKTICGRGFRYNSTYLHCQDINECEEELHNCNALTQVCINTRGSFQCQNQQKVTPQPLCPVGFQLDRESQTCVDVNECAESQLKCTHGEECVNTQGSFRCLRTSKLNSTSVSSTTILPAFLGPSFQDSNQICPAGFRYNTQSRRCFDVNECEEGTHVCSREACINEPGGYRCVPKSSDARQCQAGLKSDHATDTCVDIDECAENTDPPCDSNQECMNTHGSFQCICQTGFQLDPLLHACVDINECQLNKHDCLPSQRCDNTIGSYQCIRFTSCGTGYTLNAQTGLCEDDDECALGTDNCRNLGPTWQCRNTLGSFRCERKHCDDKKVLLSNGECKAVECPTGYEASQQGQCIDINECQRNNPCRRNQRCLNTAGSYRCISYLNCGGGFELNEAGNQCVDIDECAKSTHDCGRGQLCINRVGGYICQCPSGHVLDEQKECVDVDECTRFAGQVCAINSKCVNNVGSYRCVCNDGFRQDPKGGNGCVDIDECAESTGLCQQNCVNIWGSYRCSCNPGFTLHHDNRSCQDVDECEQFKDRNLCVGICVNQAGSYTCQCPEGYRIGIDGRTCQDIDECLDGSVCRNPNEVCLNTRGSYRCNSITCPPNFIKDPEHKNRCKRASLFCREGDTECLRLPSSISFNFITFVSNLAIPPVGYIDLFTMRGPLWSSSSVRFKLDMLDSRAPAGISPVTKDFFQLRQTSPNQAIISLRNSIQGPQQIDLQLSMELYHSGVFGGSAVAKLSIFVSEYEF
ncbi:Fibulin-1 [Cryptotermes secundus]|nr:Fibulin-1 [Cryptotermes secundus]